MEGKKENFVLNIVILNGAKERNLVLVDHRRGRLKFVLSVRKNLNIMSVERQNIVQKNAGGKESLKY